MNVIMLNARQYGGDQIWGRLEELLLEIPAVSRIQQVC